MSPSRVAPRKNSQARTGKRAIFRVGKEESADSASEVTEDSVQMWWTIPHVAAMVPGVLAVFAAAGAAGALAGHGGLSLPHPGVVPLVVAILLPRLLVLYMIYMDQGASVWFPDSSGSGGGDLGERRTVQHAKTAGAAAGDWIRLVARHSA